MRFIPALMLLVGCSPMMMTIDAGTTCSNPTKSPPNLAQNSQFECDGAQTSFSSLSAAAKVELNASGRTGRSLKLTVGDGPNGPRFSTSWKIPVTASGTYCLTGYMKSDLAGTQLQLWAANKTNQYENFVLPGPATSWSRVPPSIVIDQAAVAGDDIFIGVDKGPTVSTAAPGAVIELDDLDLWLSADGRCQEAR